MTWFLLYPDSYPNNRMKKYLLAAFLLLHTGYNFAQSVINSGSALLQKSFDINKSLPATATTAEIKVFPNPAKNKIILQVKGFVTGMASVKIIDTRGHLQREDNRLLITGDEEVVMFLSLQPAIYYILMQQKGKIAKKKLVIL